jgi:hypothetical protein
MDLQAKITEILTATAMSSSKAEVVAAAILEALPDYVQQQARTKELKAALVEIKNALEGEPEYHDQGMGCGLEDRNITDRYDAMAFGWEKAMGRVYGEHINHAFETAEAALKETT